jgi:protein-S-isoprenylcysteine O-methyltransferase Ste14
MITKSTGNSSGSHIPVPWVYTIGYLTGIGIQFIIPVSPSPVILINLVRMTGILLAAAGALLMVWPQMIFRKHKTTTVPTETTTTLITWGPYQFSRNPMYLGLFLFFAGLSVIFVLMWSIISLLVVAYYVNSRVIPIEEKQLEMNFGQAYEQYCKKVRRWI